MLLLPLCSCATPVQTCNPAPAVTLDAYFGTFDTPFVMAGINGTPAAMLFDTGASDSFLTPELAKQAGLSYGIFSDYEQFDGAAGTTGAWQVRVKQFQLGSALGEDFGFYVINLDGPQEAAEFGSDIDGDLGDDILKNYNIDLNLPEGKISLYGPAGCAASSPPWPGPADAIPVQHDWAGLIFLPVKVDGVSMPAFLDTGTAITDIPPALFASLGPDSGISQPAGSLDTIAVGGMSVKEQIYQVKEITIGHTQYENADVAVPMTRLSAADLTKLGKIMQIVEAKNPDFGYTVPRNLAGAVTLGDDFLRSHRVFIASSTNMLYVKSEPASP